VWFSVASSIIGNRKGNVGFSPYTTYKLELISLKRLNLVLRATILSLVNITIWLPYCKADITLFSINIIVVRLYTVKLGCSLSESLSRTLLKGAHSSSCLFVLDSIQRDA
jgi:hypothetical protein